MSFHKAHGTAPSIMTEREVYAREFAQDRIAEGSILPGRYSECRFLNCHLATADLEGYAFIDCTFSHCDMTMTKFTGTRLQHVTFDNCTLVGAALDPCNPFLLSIRFDQCLLDLVSFAGLKMPGTVFNACRVREADFTGADLSRSTFPGCDLERAVFANTDLEKADLSSAFGFTIDPESNNLRKIKLWRFNIDGLLSKYDIALID